MGFKSTIKALLFIFLSTTTLVCYGQSKLTFAFISDQQKIVDDYAKSIATQKTNNATQFAENLLQQLIVNGYAEASIDSTYIKDSISCFYIHVGKKYKIKSINLIQDSSIGFLNQTLELYSIQNQNFTSENLLYYLKKAVELCENSGYPYASASYKTTSIENESFSAELFCELGDLVIIDSIEIIGNLKLKPFVLEQFIGINKGNFYKQSSIDLIDKRLKKLDFAIQTKKTEVKIENNKATITTFLNKKEVNIFDGIIGFSTDEGNAGKLKLNGNLHLKLRNALRQAETIDFEWVQSNQNSQRIKVFTMAPWLIKPYFGLSYSLDFEKKDTSYIHLIHTPGIVFNWSVTNFIKPYAFIETNRNLRTTPLQLPKNQYNYNSLLYALELNLQFFDDPFLPFNGFGLVLDAAIGNKKIIKDLNTDALHFDTIKLKTTKYRICLDAEYYHQFFHRPVLKLASKIGYTFDENITHSELFKLGGNKTFRGFDEESIEASRFVLFDLEARFPIERYSYLFAFYDKAFIKNELTENNQFDAPFSFGAGISLETEVGIFAIAYSLGSRYNQAINLKASKIHIGYTARF